MRKILLIISAFWLMCVATATATSGQTIIVNGETLQKTAVKLTFDGDNVVLHFADATTATFDMATVVLTFGESSAIHSVYELRQTIDNKLSLGNLEPDTEVLVFNAAGKQIVRSTASSLDVSALNSGIYVMKAGRQIVKFIKR